VAYSVTIGAMEKPWGSSVGSSSGSSGGGSSGWVSPTGGTRKADVDEDGKDIHRQWFHLWDINENALRANIAPNYLAGYVKESSFSGISVGGAASVLDNNKEPLWKEVTSGIGTYPEVKATVTVGDNNVDLTGTMTPADIVVNDIEEIEWVPQYESETITDEEGVKRNLAELAEAGWVGTLGHSGNTTFSYHFAAIPDSRVVFPASYLNQARVKVTLAISLLEGMWDSVILRCFDPKNVAPRNTGTWSENNQTAGNSNDNFGWLTFLGQTSHGTFSLMFSNNVPGFSNSFPKERNAVVSIAEGFGDNYIVAVHPNMGTVEKYKFESNGEFLQRPDDGGNYVSLEKKLRTKVLYNAAWNGFKVPEWWIVKDMNGTIHIETEKLGTIDDPNRQGGESYAKSVLKYHGGFSLALNYQFDYSRTSQGYSSGYVLPPPPTGNNPKLSFVANSGVKLGHTGSSSFTGSTYEVAILDVVAMNNNVEPKQGMSKKETFIDAIIIRTAGSGQNAVPDVPHVNNSTGLAQERLGQLMHGIKYDILPRDFAPQGHAEIKNFNAVQAGLSQYKAVFEQNFSLVANSPHNCQTMTIMWEDTGALTVDVNGTEDYFKDNVPSIGDGFLYLQSHWGSGVIFTSATLQ
jgi:hypothetical protein